MDGPQKYGDTYFYIMTFCGKCLEVVDNSTEKGAKIHQWEKREDAESQAWKAEPDRKSVV